MHDRLLLGLAFGGYLSVVALIGWVAWRRTRGHADFVLGGRSIGRWVAALSASASDMSGWLLLGLPGYAYLSGLEAGWLAVGLALGTWGNWRLMAYRLRVFSAEAGDALTLPDYLQNRFPETGPALPLIAAFFILFFFLIYTASGLVAAGRLFETAFGMPYLAAVALGLLAIVLYTAAGGFLAVSWTDAFQAGLMFLALLAVPLAALPGAMNGETLPTALLDPLTDAQGAPLGGIALLSLLAWGLGYFGQPHILARFKAVRDPGEIPPARRIALVWVCVSLAMAVLIGLSGRVLLGPVLQGADSEKVFLVLVDGLFPPLLAGLCLAAVLAAVMSTADSQLLVSSAAFTEDVFRRVIRPGAADATLVTTGRLTVLATAVIAFLLASDRESRVLELVAYAWAGFGATFGPVLLLSLYWRRMNGRGALAGLLAGGVTVVVWRQLDGGLFALYELLPGFLFGALGAWLGALSSAPPGDPTVGLFDRARARCRR